MPEPVWTGLALLWLGIVLLIAVIVRRQHLGAWSEQAFEEPPPVGWGVRILAIVGGLCSLGGAVISIAVLL